MMFASIDLRYYAGVLLLGVGIAILPLTMLPLTTVAVAQVPPGDKPQVDASIRQAFEALRGLADKRHEGEALLKDVLDTYPSYTLAREVDLWRRYRLGGSLLPVIRHELRERAAVRLMEDDANSSGAQLVLGLLEMDLFRDAHNRVQLPSRLSEGNRIDSWLGFVDVAVERSDSATIMSVLDNEFLGARARLVRDDDVAENHARQARKYLLSALDDPFWAAEAGRTLAELSVRMRDGELLATVAAGLDRHGMYDAVAHEYWTLHYMMNGQVADAVESHRAAFKVMGADRQRYLDDLRPLAAPSNVAGDTLTVDWLDKDPIWMTRGNERAAEHMARVVAAELLFGGWENPEQVVSSDPGQLLIRYGIPSETVQFSSDADGFLLLNYPDGYFLFHDMAKAGNWIFYSSSAAALTGPRSVAPQWERDFALRAREAFEAQPDISRVPHKERVRFEAAWFVFPDEEQLTVVAAWCMPDGLVDESVDMGLYAVNDGSLRIRHLKEWRVSGRRDERECRPDIERADVAAGSWRFSLESVAEDTYAVSRKKVVVSTMSSVVPARLIVDREPGKTRPEGYFERGDVWIQPLVPARIHAHEFVTVYAEAYGIPGDVRSVSVEAVLRPRVDERRQRLFMRNRKEAVSVRFEQEVTGRSAAVRVVLDVGNVEPGAYDLVVRVSGGGSYNAENRTTLDVLEDVDG